MLRLNPLPIYVPFILLLGLKLLLYVPLKLMLLLNHLV
jgi:hypothetical protein